MLNEYDIQFLKKMIPHHEMAVDMAATVLKSGSDSKVAALAKAIETGQGKEITLMTGWLSVMGNPFPRLSAKARPAARGIRPAMGRSSSRIHTSR